VVVGFAGGEIASIAINRLLLPDASVAGVYWGAYTKNDPDRLQSVFDAVFGMWGKGTIKPVVSAVLPIQDAPAAIKMISARQTHGKVILVSEDGCRNSRVLNRRLSSMEIGGTTQ
jgi:NADPH:quinone reductase